MKVRRLSSLAVYALLCLGGGITDLGAVGLQGANPPAPTNPSPGNPPGSANPSAQTNPPASNNPSAPANGAQPAG